MQGACNIIFVYLNWDKLMQCCLNYFVAWVWLCLDTYECHFKAFITQWISVEILKVLAVARAVVSRVLIGKRFINFHALICCQLYFIAIIASIWMCVLVLCLLYGYHMNVTNSVRYCEGRQRITNFNSLVYEYLYNFQQNNNLRQPVIVLTY